MIMIPRRISHLHWLRLLWLEIGERRGCGGGGDLQVKVFCFRDPSDMMIVTSKVKGSDLMMGCWNFSIKVGGLKSVLLTSEDSLNLR